MIYRPYLLFIRNVLAVVLLFHGLFGIQGCAPRYLEKTPGAVLRYPYIPVEQAELDKYRTQLAEPYYPQAAQARFWIAQNEFNQSRWLQAEKRFSQIIKKYPGSEWAPVAGVMIARCQVKRKKPLAALTELLHVKTSYPGQAQVADGVELLAQKIINDELSLTELAQVRATYQNTLWAEQAQFVIGKRNLDSGNPSLAIKSFEQFIRLYPQSQFAPIARELMEKAVRIVPVNRRHIGCLLPLSGPYAPYGRTIQQGLELALAQINRYRDESEYVSLTFVDTFGTTSGAVAGYNQLAEKEKAMMIIGPTLSNNVKAIIPELQKKKACVLTTSAAEIGLPAKSPYLFRYMLTNQEQGMAMAEYMVLRKNYQRIGVLNGEAPYDRSLADAFMEKVTQLGGEIVARLEYPRGATDFKTQMIALGGIDPGLLKDLKVRERKSMEKIVEKIAYKSYEAIVPQPKTEGGAKAAPTPAVPEKKVAIIRFTEVGEQTQKEKLGKLFTEQVSYALAPRDGVEVLTQAKTFKALREAGLSTLSLSVADWRTLAEKLEADFLILGQVKQLGEETVHLPGEPLPIKYQVDAKLVSTWTGKTLKEFKLNWTKSIPPEFNVKNMEALYLPVPARDAILIASQLVFYDLKVAIFGCDAWMTPKFFRRAGRELKDAVLATGYWPKDASVRNKEFVKQFESTYKAQPTLLAVQAYDALFLVAEALKKMPQRNAQREDFRKALLGLDQFNGITGRAAVGPNGEVKREVMFLKMKNKKLRRVR